VPVGPGEKTDAKKQVQVACTACGAAIGRHEPLVIVSRDNARRGTLATESRPLVKGEAAYHPDCYGPVDTEPSPGAGRRRVFKEALCGVDGDEGSFAAVEQAASLVGPGGQLTLLVVTSLRTGVGQMPPLSAMDMVEHATMLADRAGVSCTVEIDPAKPVQDVVGDWAAGHDLLAIGAPPRSVMAGMWLSGVTNTALRSRSTPILFARSAGGDSRFGPRTLVASDAMRGSDELVAFARRVAEEGDSALTLIHAQRSRVREHKSRIDAQAKSIQQYGRGIDDNWAVIESGSAAEAIIASSARLKASLVMMTSRRRSGLSVLGSVSRRVVHHASCSVLLVPPERLQQSAQRSA
jgi:nucleotide-binding universal stress UspA family protein